MTSQEILTKAIKEAINGGWTGWREFTDWGWESEPTDIVGQVMAEFYEREFFNKRHVPELIFDHAFAKCLWGEKDIDLATLPEWKEKSLRIAGKPAWEWHLEHMVIENDPIQYLGNNI